MNRALFIISLAFMLVAGAYGCAGAGINPYQTYFGDEGIVPPNSIPEDAVEDSIILPEYDFSSAVALLKSILKEREASVSTEELEATYEALKGEIEIRRDIEKAIGILKGAI